MNVQTQDETNYQALSGSSNEVQEDSRRCNCLDCSKKQSAFETYCRNNLQEDVAPGDKYMPYIWISEIGLFLFLMKFPNVLLSHWKGRSWYTLLFFSYSMIQIVYFSYFQVYSEILDIENIWGDGSIFNGTYLFSFYIVVVISGVYTVIPRKESSYSIAVDVDGNLKEGCYHVHQSISVAWFLLVFFQLFIDWVLGWNFIFLNLYLSIWMYSTLALVCLGSIVHGNTEVHLQNAVILENKLNNDPSFSILDFVKRYRQCISSMSLFSAKFSLFNILLLLAILLNIMFWSASTLVAEIRGDGWNHTWGLDVMFCSLLLIVYCYTFARVHMAHKSINSAVVRSLPRFQEMNPQESMVYYQEFLGLRKNYGFITFYGFPITTSSITTAMQTFGLTVMVNVIAWARNQKPS